MEEKTYLVIEAAYDNMQKIEGESKIHAFLRLLNNYGQQVCSVKNNTGAGETGPRGIQNCEPTPQYQLV